MTPSGLTRRKKNVLCSFGIVQRRSRIWLQWQNPGSRIQTRGNLVKTQIGKNHHDTKKSVINTPIWQKIENMVNHSHLPVRLPTPHNRHSYSKICMFYLHCNSICRHPNTTTSSAPQYYYIHLHLIHSSNQQRDLVASPLSLTPLGRWSSQTPPNRH